MASTKAPPWLILTTYAIVVLVGALFGEAGGYAAYMLVAVASVSINARSWLSNRSFTPFLVLALSMAAFATGRTWDYFGLQGQDPIYLVAYALTSVAIFSIVRVRTKHINIESVLEAGMLAAGSLLLMTQAWVLTGAESAVSSLTFAAPVLVFLLGSGFLGQGAAGPAMRWWFVAVIAAILAELPYAISEDVFLVSQARIHLGALAFVPVLIAATFPPPVAMEEGSKRRRHVGLPQVVTIFSLLVLPIVLLSQLAFDANEGATVTAVLIAAVGVTITVVGRFWLLIRRRDWSNHCDQVLAQLGEQLVLVENADEAAQAVADAAVKMDSRGLVVAKLVDEKSDATPTAASSGIVDTLARGLVDHADDTAEQIQTALDLSSRAQTSVIAAKAGSYSLYVGANTHEVGDLKPYVRTLATQLALVLDAMKAREESHKARANNRMRALVQDSSDILFLVDGPTERIEFASPNLEQHLGVSEDSLIGAHPLSILTKEDRSFAEEKLARSDGTGELSELDVRGVHADGHQHWLSLSVRDYTDDPDVGGLVYNYADINERKLAELQLGSSELQYRTMVMNASDVFAVIDADSIITFISPNIERLLGFDASELIGTSFQGLFTEGGKKSYETYRSHFEKGIGNETADVQVRTGMGSTMTAEIELAQPDELGTSLMVSMRDVTENRALAENVRTRAENDDLTGLLNRNGLQDSLKVILNRMRPDEYLATVTLDINDFNRINENLGYLGGDELLVNVASRLRSHMREGDSLSRQSGDEFTLLSVHRNKAAGDAFAERIAGIFDESFVIGGRKIKVKASIGAIVTDDVQGVSKRVLEASKMALNFAKADRHKSFVVFENWMREEAAVHFDIALDLADAMRTGEIHLAFQPIMSLDTNRVRTVEALLRWQHPIHGNVSPGVFVPIAERSGEIVELGRWALDHACRQTATWNQELPGGESLGVSVNLSLLQLEELSEAEVLQTIVRDSGLDPHHLMVELTESVMITDPNLLRRQLDGFRQLGCKIAVDDFGSGVAGMSHLHDAGRLDVLKIDRRYIEGVDRRDDARTIVSGVIDLAHRMGAKAVAEGIETPPQAEALRRLNCDYGQGFYLGRPMVANRIEKWFSQGWQGEVPALIDRTETW